MAFVDWFIKGDHAGEDELMRPMPNEDSDLPTHVEVCARRYKSLKDSINHGIEGQRWTFILIGLLFLAAFFKEPVQGIMGSVL